MKLLITGANGFLGKYVVAEAISQGHEVQALVRPATKTIPDSWDLHPALRVIRGDLRSRVNLDHILTGVDGVIHLAACKSGDLYEQLGGTVLATENLLSAMATNGIERMVVTSSFSVYEYQCRWSWSCIDEQSPLALIPSARDEYCQTKLEQERIVREFGKSHLKKCIILRPGVIFGKDNLWTARLGIQLGNKWWLRIGSFAPLPLTYVENCAQAIVLAAEYDRPERELTLNIVDNNTPSQQAYIRELRHHLSNKPRIIPVPWLVMRFLARTVSLGNYICFGGNAKVPGLFIPSRLHARCKPFRYSNSKAVSILGWTPRFTWQEGLARSQACDV